MNLRELTEACQYAIAEVSDAFFPREVWRGFLNAAQNEFARKTRCIERISQGRTAPGRRVYPLDLDFFHINLVRCGDRVLKPIASYDMEARARRAWTSHALSRQRREAVSVADSHNSRTSGCVV